MSVSLVLVPLAIALTITVKETVYDKLKQNNNLSVELPAMQTIFNDAQLLAKTLQEHGLHVTVISENQLVCQVADVRLSYERQNLNEAFFVNISGVKDFGKFLSEIECFEREYKQNVQSFTYDKLVHNLAENNMTIAEETVLDDNSIMLTINI